MSRGRDADARRRDISTGIQIEKNNSPIKQSATDALDERDDRGHSRDDALSERQFEQLVRASYEVDHARREIENRFAVFACGRLGMRGGEVTHFKTGWIDWNDKIIEIPDHDPCDKGKFDGEVCGYCRRRAIDYLTTNNLTIGEAVDAIEWVTDDDVLALMDDDEIFQEALDLRDDVNITYWDAIEKYWEPKTSQSVREIPFDFDVRIELCLEQFCDTFDGWERSKATLNRRIDRLAEIAGLEENVYPHSLRATAASNHASREISAYSLMSIMGWSDIGTARSYIRANSEQANREIRSKHR